MQILLVEDDPLFRTIIARMAENLGFEIVSAENGKTALGLLRTRCFDLILMDVEMPEMDGYATMENIRKNYPEAAAIPIIIITGNEKPQQAPQSLLKGANAFLPKPFTEKQLLSEIEALFMRF
ncbi:response regulator [Adhaeribacter soli]|uniref:Response regulator n=1 Tax=Adhaeribacter soli TaxID=2607655 RepID=A0A5N1IS33_9BACT|nr:response regulator [Adhaeribacter soli]KAA9332787.1 response regulator [Adhaeribacter soli]